MLDELLKPYENQYGIFAMTPGDLREFAEKIASAEREACAKLVEADGLARGKTEGMVLLKNAERIRARSER